MKELNIEETKHWELFKEALEFLRNISVFNLSKYMKIQHWSVYWFSSSRRRVWKYKTQIKNYLLEKQKEISDLIEKYEKV